jgi:hypothetical protein
MSGEMIFSFSIISERDGDTLSYSFRWEKKKKTLKTLQ